MPLRRRLPSWRYTVEHPDHHYTHAPAPGLALVLAAQGVTYEALSELTGYPVEYLRKMAEEGQIAPRIVTSRISAVLGVETSDIRGEYREWPTTSTSNT